MVVRVGVVSVPAVPFAPVQPPLAVQEVLLILVQESVVVWPVVTEAGVAVKEVTAGVETVVTVTDADFGALTPPAPVQVNV